MWRWRSPSHRGVNWNTLEDGIANVEMWSPSHRGVNWNKPFRGNEVAKCEAPPTGAWIEMKYDDWKSLYGQKPLPQGRELKLNPSSMISILNEAPPTGARIEIYWSHQVLTFLYEAPPTGEWIEICHQNRLFSHDTQKLLLHFQEKQ